MKFVFLSSLFYGDYQNCPEIMQKQNRPYACLTVRIGGNLFAIPIRHTIKHDYCFHTIAPRGLDFTKAVIIRNKNDIGQYGVIISSEEFNILKQNEDRIIREFKRYIKTFKNASAYKHQPQFQNIYYKSTLQYFEEYL